MPLCYLIPGFAGSQLAHQPDSRVPVWVNYLNLASGDMRELALAADGVSPGPPYGVTLYPQRPLPDYYEAAGDELQGDLRDRGYVIVRWGYDWRLSARTTGALLAAAIRAGVTSAEPCSLVGHSYGGLVARVAWAELVATGETALIRRIVTLGTPHRGSYRPLIVLAGDDEIEQQLVLFSTVAQLGLGHQQSNPRRRPYTRQELAVLAGTWPSLYELFPEFPTPGDVIDPARGDIYTTRLYRAGAIPSQTWLDYARMSWWPFLADPVSNPPVEVLTTVAGTGVPTPATLIAPDGLGTSAAIGNAIDGDGAVTLESALLAVSKQVRIPGLHGMLPLTVAQGDVLADLVIEERPPTPPPAPVRVAAQFTPIVAGPPFPVPLTSTADP